MDVKLISYLLTQVELKAFILNHQYSYTIQIMVCHLKVPQTATQLMISYLLTQIELQEMKVQNSMGLSGPDNDTGDARLAPNCQEMLIFP